MKNTIVFLLLSYCSFAFNLELKQVLILGRHNLRTPLTAALKSLSPKTWPDWGKKTGELTEKGALLEELFGEYFSEWLRYHGLIPEGCPVADSLHIYANTRQRTRATAKAFVSGAFRNCNVPVYVINGTESDPVFNPVVHNSSAAYREQATSEIMKNLNMADLSAAYEELNRISDIKNSQICKEQGLCDLTDDKGEIVVKVGMQPNVTGSLYIGTSMVDSFLMGYYEGFPAEDIAWGEIETEEQWRQLSEVVKEYMVARFNLPKSAKDIAQPLLKYMKKMLSSNKTFTMLVGHDSNLNPVITALGFKLYTLPDQLEISPIGSKLVFQRWSDGENDFLKVEYVYGSMLQIRNAEKLSLLNPPKNITMFFKCLESENGFYPWSSFEKKLRDVTN